MIATVLKEMNMRPILPPALLALTLALAGCGGTVNRGLESVHQPVVSRTDYVVDVAEGSNGLAPGERERLEGWFRSIGLAYGDRISVDDPTGSPAAREDVAAVAGRHGILVSRLAPVTAGPIEPGTLRVVVSRASAVVPNCPDWSRHASPEFVGSGMSNYGCAANTNLAAMVANPEDLVRGEDPAGTIDASTAGKAIKSWREAKPTGEKGLKIESTKGGN